MLAPPRAQMHHTIVSSLTALSLTALSLIALLTTGCARIERRGKSPLSPLRMSQESVTLEKFSVRFPCGDEDLNGPLWNDVDEQCFSPELRRRLAANGLRAGLVGNQLPAALDRLLASSELRPPTQTSTQIQMPEADLVNEPTVLRGLIQNQGGQRAEVIVAGEREPIASLSLLQTSDDGRVGGKTLNKVVGVLALRMFPQGDGRTRLEIIPELKHGEVKQRVEADNGVLRFDIGPDREVFHDLRLEAALAPGQMILLTCLPNRPGSLGHHLFTEEPTGQPRQQKMLLFRLAYSPLDDRFTAEPSPPR
jgi:hypothetical protein